MVSTLASDGDAPSADAARVGSALVGSIGLAGQEREPELAHLHLVPVLQRLLRLDPPPVDVRAVEAAQVAEAQAVAFADDHRVLAGDRHVVEEDVALGRPPDGDAIADQGEELTLQDPAGAHGEVRPLDARRGPAGRLELVSVQVERPGRLAGLALDDQQGAAALAEPMGLALVEPALGAVHERLGTSGLGIVASVTDADLRITDGTLNPHVRVEAGAPRSGRSSRTWPGSHRRRSRTGRRP